MNNGNASLYEGWAVMYHFDFGWAFCGRYYFPGAIPEHMHGHITSVFRTKKEAIVAVKKLGFGPFNKYRVTKVIVSVVENRHRIKA